MASTQNATAATPTLTLRPLTVHDEQQAHLAHQELQADGSAFLHELQTQEPWPLYVQRLQRLRNNVGVLPGRVPATFLVAEVNGQLVGSISVRHELNMFLAQWGGHIGYVVRPAFRRHGYATQMLRQSLPIARTVGLKRVLVTCDDTNIGSARVIERCGGILQNKLPGPDGQPPKRRYWIEMTGVAHHPE